MNEPRDNKRLKARVDAQNAAQSTQGFIAHIVTSGRISVIDDWLGQNIKGRWSIRVEGGTSAEGATKYAIRFSEASDHALFRERFTKAKS